jgi:DNA-binding transcriptional LysR family regulator
MNIDRLDLNLLRLLVALHETRSVTRAGQRLALSQPAASNALARLREQFGDPLYIRSPSGLQPTALAARLAPALADHLHQLQQLMKQPASFEPGSAQFSIRMSLSDLGEITFFPKLIGHLRQNAPGVRVVNKAVASDQTRAALQNQDIDLALGILPINLKGLRSKVLFTEPYVALSGPFFPYDHLSLAVLQRCQLVIATPSATQHHHVQEILKNHKLTDQVALHAKHYGALADIVFSTDYLAIVPSNYARTATARMPLTRWVLPIDSPTYDVRMVWDQSSDRDPAHQWLREIVCSLFQRQGR